MRNSVTQAFAAVLIFLAAGCGDGSHDDAPSPVAAQQTPPPTVLADAPDPAEQEDPLSPVLLTLQREAGAPVGLTTPLKFKATGGTLSIVTADYTVYLNDTLLPDSAISVTSQELTVTTPLNAGKNRILIFAPDSGGAPIEASSDFWAGDSAVAGLVVDSAGNPIPGATVIAKLGDDPTVTATTTTGAAGTYTLPNFPSRTVLVSVTGPTGVPGSTSGVGGEPFPNTVLIPFGTPVLAPNTDFSIGAEGWKNLTGARVDVVDHVEAVGPAQGTASSPPLSFRLFKLLPLSSAYAQATVPNKDLRVTTNGEGPRTVTHTFVPQAGAKSVKVRYRFITSEYPIYYNTEFNDSYEVKVRTAAGKFTSTFATMNGLGSAAFAADGSTAWKTLELDLAPAAPGAPPETVQIDLTVSNVGDGDVDSTLIVDAVSSSKIAIESAELFDIDNTSVGFLSAAKHSYFGGNTRLNATFKISGPSTAKLASLELQVLQNGAVKAKGKLTPSLAPTVYVPFGSQGFIEVKQPQLAFEIPALELDSVNRSTNSTLTLKLEAKSDAGDSVTKEFPNFQVLDFFPGTARYPAALDDIAVGGDDWVLPSVRDVLQKVSVTWGDFSNMNAGTFAPDHKSHTQGRDADGHYAGYNKIDAATAAKMIALINTEGVRDKVKIVYVTHVAKAGNAFYDAIKDVKLADGRPATKVIRNYPKHGTHFHWNVE